MVEATEPKTIQKAMQIAGTLSEKRGNWGEPSKDRNVRDDNKRTRTGNAFAITTNLVEREHKNVNPINARNPVARACYECGSTDHINSAYPRLNQA
ncbi:hypothetical protein Tco_1433781 [Tanacetum coccineum]